MTGEPSIGLSKELTLISPLRTATCSGRTEKELLLVPYLASSITREAFWTTSPKMYSLLVKHCQIANKTTVYSVYVDGNAGPDRRLRQRSQLPLLSNTSRKNLPLRSVYVNRNHKIYRKSAAKNVQSEGEKNPIDHVTQ